VFSILSLARVAIPRESELRDEVVAVVEEPSEFSGVTSDEHEKKQQENKTKQIVKKQVILLAICIPLDKLWRTILKN